MRIIYKAVVCHHNWIKRISVMDWLRDNFPTLYAYGVKS